MSKRLCLLMLLTACAAAQTVEGTVLDAASGKGAAGVQVELLKQTTPFYETTTDAGGHFRFDGIKEGDYSVRYQSPDYWLTAGPSTYRPFHVGEGDPVKLETRLMPWSKISGRVVDRQGNGVPKAQVEITGAGMLLGNRIYMRTSWGGGGGMQLGPSVSAMSFRGETDAQGRFEVRLMPGSYGLSVFAPPELKPPAPEPDGPVLAWKRTYYPGVALPDAASKIVVLPGAEVADVEMKLMAVPTHAVRGVVLYPDGTPAPKATILFNLESPMKPTQSGPDGAFDFPAVPEGEWRFVVEAQKAGIRFRAIERIDVTKHDIEDVKLRLGEPFIVRGKVTTDAPAGSPQPRLPLFVLARSGGRGAREDDLGTMGGIPFAGADANGNFVSQDAYPGAYHLSPLPQPPPAPYYLDVILAGDINLVTQDADLASGDVTLNVVYKSDGGSVRGTAENCFSGGVLLVPQDPSLWRGFFRSGPCDAGDRYEVTAVRPGEYFALAFAGNGPVLAVDDALLNQAVKVTVRANLPATADLRTVTRPIF